MKKSGLILLLLLTAGIFLSCDDSGESETIYSFHVYSTGNDFSGIYNIDGGSEITFSDEDDLPDNGYYIYNKNIEGNPTSIRITVVGLTTGGPSGLYTSYIRAEVYKDNVIVAEREDSQTEGTDTIGITLKYNFVDDSEEDEEE